MLSLGDGTDNSRCDQCWPRNLVIPRLFKSNPVLPTQFWSIFKFFHQFFNILLVGKDGFID
jgi:hypothetical protein